MLPTASVGEQIAVIIAIGKVAAAYELPKM
jgi:hypothetical protein